MKLSPVIQGNKTVIWGSGGVLNSAEIVEDADVEPIVAEATIEDNNGFTITHVMIPDGDKRNVTVVARRDIPLPTTGTILKVWGMLCSCVKASPKKARKKEMTAKIEFVRYAGIDYEALWDEQNPSSSGGAGPSAGPEESILASESQSES